jgi:hypothetical protein
MVETQALLKVVLTWGAAIYKVPGQRDWRYELPPIRGITYETLLLFLKSQEKLVIDSIAPLESTIRYDSTWICYLRLDNFSIGFGELDF